MVKTTAKGITKETFGVLKIRETGAAYVRRIRNNAEKREKKFRI